MKRIIVASLTSIVLASCASLDKESMTENKTDKAQSTQIAENDSYLWLEEVEGERALNWVRENNTRSLNKLQSDPRYKKLEEDALAIVRAKDRLTFGGYSQGYVSNFWQDATQIRGLWRRASFDSWRANAPQWEPILDFDKLSKDEGKNWVYKGASCLDPNDQWNTVCLLSLSNGGKDANEKREFDIKTKSFVKGGFLIPEAKSDITWIDKDNIYVGTNWGEGTLTESGYPFVVKKLTRGQDLKDAKEVFRGEIKDVAASAYRIDDGTKYRTFFRRSPTFFTDITFYLNDDNSISQLALPLKHNIIGMRGDEIFFTIAQDWTPRGSSRLFTTGTLLHVPLKELIATSGEIRPNVIYTPAAREALESASITKSGLVLEIMNNVKSEIRNYTLTSNNSWTYKRVDLPPNGVASIADSGIRQDEIFYSYNDFITPPSILYAANIDAKPLTVQAQAARFSAEGLEVSQFEAKSKDGTMIPYFVVRKKGVPLNGQTPTLLYGYGGFEVSMQPNYSAYTGKMWLERGGAYVLANIRGGGEFGPEWHQAGLKTKRQIIYDDFIGVAEDLIAKRITSPRRLGIMGGSNGGLLMGVMFNQRPDLFNAVVIQVPLLDMLRYDKLLAGASWVDEYGSPSIPEERAWLEKMSPYHNLKKSAKAPVPFIVTSTKDDRVHPGHARKFGAKMDELGMPYLYYENIDGGHSAAANLVEGAKRRALEYTYLTQKLMD